MPLPKAASLSLDNTTLTTKRKRRRNRPSSTSLTPKDLWKAASLGANSARTVGAGQGGGKKPCGRGETSEARRCHLPKTIFHPTLPPFQPGGGEPLPATEDRGAASCTWIAALDVWIRGKRSGELGRDRSRAGRTQGSSSTTAVTKDQTGTVIYSVDRGNGEGPATHRVPCGRREHRSEMRSPWGRLARRTRATPCQNLSPPFPVVRAETIVIPCSSPSPSTSSSHAPSLRDLPRHP